MDLLLLLLNEMTLSPGRDIKRQIYLAESALDLIFVYLLTAAEVFGFASFSYSYTDRI